MPKPRWELPAPTYEKDVNRAVDIYRRAIIEILALISQLATHGSENKEISQAQMNAVFAQLAVLLQGVDRDAEAWIKEQIFHVFTEGQAEALFALGEAKSLDEARAAVAAAPMSALSTATIAAMVDDTFEHLLAANDKMKKSTIKMVRDVVAEQMRTKAAQGMGRNTTRNAIVESLSKKGFKDRWEKEGDVAIISRNGRTWRIRDYAEMVTRTKMLEAFSEGQRVQAVEMGIDLAIISSHGAKDACRHFEGQVISMTGQTEGFLTYDELRRSNLIFHPNCKHRITPVRSLDLLPEAVRRKYEEGKKEALAAFKAQKRKK